MNLDYLKELVAYWRDGFDWRQVEARWNTFDHYTADASGSNSDRYRIHFIHEAGSGDSPLPLILNPRVARFVHRVPRSDRTPGPSRTFRR